MAHPPPQRLTSTDREPRRSLEHSVRDGCAHAVMLGCGEAYLSTFGIFLGMAALPLGILATLPLLAGSLAQLAAVRLLDRIPKRKPLVVWPALAQGLAWAPLFLLPFLFRERSSVLLLLVALVYFVLGSFISPAWNSWMGDLLPARLRGSYFGNRERLRMAFQLAALLAGGLTLSVSRRLGSEWGGFACIFALALLARLISARHLLAMTEPRYRAPGPEHAFSLLDFVRRSPWSNFGRFTVYVALLMAATSLSGPFFSLFMLRDLDVGYLRFTAASAVTLLAQIFTVRQWGRLGDRFGNRVLLKHTGLLLPVVPALWLVSTRFEAILLWQAIAGVLWAGFNLSAVNFLFDAVTPPKRARCVAYYNLLVHAGTFAGAVIGGAILPLLPSALPYPGGSLRLVSGVQILFLLSALARLVLALAFLPVIREVRPVKSFGNVFVRIAGLAAARGPRLSLYSPDHSRQSADEDGEDVKKT